MYPRKIYHQIKPYFKTRDIIVIHGSRQTGKTTLLKLLMKDLPIEDSYYFDLEDSRLLYICEEGTESIINYLKQKGILKQQEIFYLLIDEIQYLSNPSSLLKLMHDNYSQMKLIVTGSSSFAIKSKFKDTLVGRTVNFELYPLSFEEFLIFKNKTFEINKKITIKAVLDELTMLYKEYVLFGAYPKIVLTEIIDMKERYLQQIVDTYIKGDIRDLARIKDISKFNKLLQILASQSGQLLNVTELSNTAQIAKQTIEDYLFILQNTYIIRLLPPYSRNIRSELFKTPKVFFYDTGLLNILWLKTLPKEITGNIFETSIFSELVKNIGINNIYHWRTQDKKEIDFIISNKHETTPVEAKLNAGRLNFTALKYFNNKYSLKKCYCISLEGKLPGNKFVLKNIKPWEIYTEFGN